ncbi:hypothetical protein [Streptomyces cinnamoneus]|uniref:Uncharacterized protein n=1 Tax=Streptomyces cinnamoneus TaxID=53446 RepID=A0A918WQU3_STRCJ|nr:hypothetical protein [Streptomyces cinnamoneus]GHC69419.1 hypothetical protein GCM10010507_55420 [Streptomyces cinnamoneus]
MSPDGDPPPPPPHHPPPPPHPPDPRFWSRVWTYWVTGGLAVVLAAVIPVVVKAGPFATDGHPDPPATTFPPTASPTPSPSPVLSTTPQVKVGARVNSVTPLGAVTPTVTKVQANVTFTGLKGRSGYLKWHTYNDSTKITMSEDSTISSPVLNWDSTDWKPTFIVPTPTVPWQLQVTVYGPDGQQLATGHSNFTFNSSTSS